jgi:hypothetical protein
VAEFVLRRGWQLDSVASEKKAERQRERSERRGEMEIKGREYRLCWWAGRGLHPEKGVVESGVGV